MVLDCLIDMIDQGKILAENETHFGKQESAKPWIMPSYTERDLEETVQAFEKVVAAFHARLPSHLESIGENLLDVVTDAMPDTLPANSFARRYLARCSRPGFTHIAPGLSIAQCQPFAPESGHAMDDKLFPFLPFSSTLPAHKQTRRTPWSEQMYISPFTRDFDSVAIYPAGLYLTETNYHGTYPFEDGCKLILPFTLGSNVFARTSDGALIGEHVRRAGGDGVAEIKPKSADLYQLGFNHFIATHDIQLKYVLWKWLEMIEEGRWKVDGYGVVGGEEKWREADTEEH
jgi:hypothetical protein